MKGNNILYSGSSALYISDHHHHNDNNNIYLFTEHILSLMHKLGSKNNILLVFNQLQEVNNAENKMGTSTEI